jgi:hypothetical protein
MTLQEKLETGMKCFELEDQGKFKEADELHKRIPLAPYLAMFYKKHMGIDALLDTGWNLWEAVEEYGPDFLTK